MKLYHQVITSEILSWGKFFSWDIFPLAGIIEDKEPEQLYLPLPLILTLNLTPNLNHNPNPN